MLDPDLRVKIQRCHDPSMWYAGRVGEWIKVERLDSDGIFAREPEGYLNIIKYEDIEDEQNPNRAE